MALRLRPFQVFVGEAAGRFPVLYDVRHQLHNRAKRAAFRAIAALARRAGFLQATARSVIRAYNKLKRKYWYVQYRLHEGHLLQIMATAQLQTTIICHYLFETTFHRDFVNIDIRDEAAQELFIRIGWVYVPREALAAVEHLLPRLPGDQELEQVEQQVPAAANDPRPVDPHPNQYPLPRRMIGNYADIIVVEPGCLCGCQIN